MLNRLPAWFKQDIPDRDLFFKIRSLSEAGINTVCREAMCPNISHCFKCRQLTFMILGDRCTRSCLFCAVKKSEASALSVDSREPDRVARSVSSLSLKYVVITSVTRDDLGDGGAEIFARTIYLIRQASKGVRIEVLIPDFKGAETSLKKIVTARPSCLAHNIETVRRLYKDLRPQADYERSLELLGKVKEMAPAIVTKSSLMLGLGETPDEVEGLMRDLRKASVDILTLGQYLAPSSKHYPVKEFISPGQFGEYRLMGIDFGFKAVASGPLVRSSYQAQENYRQATCTI